MPAAGHQPGDGAHKRPGQSQRGTRWLEQVNTCCRDISTVKFAMILLSKIRNVVLVWCQDSPGWSNRGTRWFKQDPGFVQTSFLDPVFSTHSKLSLCSLYCILIKVSLLVTIFKQPPIELVIYGHPLPIQEKMLNLISSPCEERMLSTIMLQDVFTDITASMCLLIYA